MVLKQIEKSTGKPVVSKLNAKNFGQREIKNNKTRNIKEIIVPFPLCLCV